MITANDNAAKRRFAGVSINHRGQCPSDRANLAQMTRFVFHYFFPAQSSHPPLTGVWWWEGIGWDSGIPTNVPRWEKPTTKVRMIHALVTATALALMINAQVFDTSTVRIPGGAVAQRAVRGVGREAGGVHNPPITDHMTSFSAKKGAFDNAPLITWQVVHCSNPSNKWLSTFALSVEAGTDQMRQPCTPFNHRFIVN